MSWVVWLVLAVIVAAVAAVTGNVEIAKVAFVCPAGTTTVPGTKVAVLFVLFKVNGGLFPARHLLAKLRDLFAQPDEALNLLELELAMFLFQLLQTRGMVSPGEFRQRALPRGCLL